MDLEYDIGRELFKTARRVSERILEPMRDEHDCVRASSIPYLCPREEYLAWKYDVNRYISLDPSLEITFQIGTYFHELYRTEYFGPMGTYVGAWECTCGENTDKIGLSRAPVAEKGHIVEKGLFAKQPLACPSCGKKGMAFMEWNFSDQEIGIKGHPDGWSIGYNGLTMVDLKTHGASNFSSRNSLRPGHDTQVMAYCWMTGTPSGRIWYLNKSPWGDHRSFIRDIPVVFDSKKFKRDVIDPVYEVRTAIANNVCPDRKKQCDSYQSSCAQKCPLSKICFNGVI